MAKALRDIFHQGLSDGKDIYVVEGTRYPGSSGVPAADTDFRTPILHVVVEKGELPDEAEVAERTAPYESYGPTAPRLMSYEELAERQRIREEAWAQAEANF